MFNNFDSGLKKSYFIGGRYVLEEIIRDEVSKFAIKYQLSSDEIVFFEALNEMVFSIIPNGTNLDSYISINTGEVISNSDVITNVSVRLLSDLNIGYSTLAIWLDTGLIEYSEDIEWLLDVAIIYFNSLPDNLEFVFSYDDLLSFIENLRVFIEE
jgi:hypothetical protein